MMTTAMTRARAERTLMVAITVAMVMPARIGYACGGKNVHGGYGNGEKDNNHGSYGNGNQRWNGGMNHRWNSRKGGYGRGKSSYGGGKGGYGGGYGVATVDAVVSTV